MDINFYTELLSLNKRIHVHESKRAKAVSFFFFFEKRIDILSNQIKPQTVQNDRR